MNESMTRTVTIDHTRADEESRTVYATLSTEYGIVRSYGNEILLHESDAVDLTRTPFPLVVDHDTSELPIGLVEQVRVVGRKLKGVLRFGESERAKEIWQDVRSGVIRNLSIGYRIHDSRMDGEDLIVTSWEPYEVSAVAVGADPHAGIGRSMKKVNEMEKMSRSERKAQKRSNEDVVSDINEILHLGKQHGEMEMAQDEVRNGTSLEDFHSKLLGRIALSKMISHSKPEGNPVLIGMNQNEMNNFSFVRAIRAHHTGDWRRAGLEREAIQAAADQVGKSTENIVIPPDMMQRDLAQRDFTKAGTSSASIQTTILSSSFIDILRNHSLLLDRVQMLAGLTGDIAIPRMSGSATSYWVAEGSNVTESTPTLDQVTLQPKTVGGLVDISRKMLLQSTPDAEMMIRNDLGMVLATEVDRAIINGSGSGAEPEGILNTSGIGSVAIDTNGGAPTWSHMMELIEDVAAANADNNGVFVTNAAVEAKLRKTAKVSSTDSMMILEESGKIAGRDVLVTNQVPSDLTKGAGSSLSAIVYGDISQVLMGQWGTLELDVDKSNQFASGAIRVRALWDVDVAVRHAAAFSAVVDAVTT